MRRQTRDTSEEGTLSGRCHAPREEDEHPCMVVWHMRTSALSMYGTPGDCTLEEKFALRSCLMSIHALAWMSISAPFEREQVDTVFEIRSRYPDLTTEGEDMMNNSSGIKDHPVVSHEEWLSARTAFLAREKEFTRLRDELSQQRRALPWEKVDKQYVFDGPKGKETLAELFGGKSQLIVYH